jgi:hypothetical protein
MSLSLHGRRSARRGRATAALIAALAAAHRTSAEPPPWIVESPGGAGASIAVGLDGLYDDVDRLTIRSAKTTVTLRDPDGGISVQRIDGDPALLNRKFKVGWKLKGVGAQIPAKLPYFRFGAFSVYPSFVLQIANVETTLSTRDLPEPAQSTSLDGHGLLLGGTLGAVVPLCDLCGRFAVAGYRYRLVPGLSATGSQPLGDPGLQATRDDVRLRQTTSDFFLRLGSTYAHGRLAASLGIVSRRTQIDVRDKLGFRSALGEETSLDTRTRYDRRATGAIADLDAHLTGPFYLRAEAIVAGSDRSALLKAAYLPTPWNHGAGSKERKAEERRAREIAAAISGPLKRILDEYRARADGLAKADPPYPLAEVARLFDDTERKLIQALGDPELAALRASVTDVFAHARRALDIGPAAGAVSSRAGSSQIVLVRLPPTRSMASTVRLAGDDGSAGSAGGPDDGSVRRRDRVDCAGGFLERLWRLATTSNLQVRLRVETSKPGLKATYSMHPERYPGPAGASEARTTTASLLAWRGSHEYKVHKQNFKDIDAKLDLVSDPEQQVLVCDMVPTADAAEPQPCERRLPRTVEECPE